MAETNPTPLDAERERLRKTGYTEDEISQIFVKRAIEAASKQPAKVAPVPPLPKKPAPPVATESIQPIPIAITEVMLILIAVVCGYFEGFWPALFAWFVLNIMLFMGIKGKW